MARPIAFEVPPYDPREALRKRLEAAPVEYAEALLESYELLQQLHETGTLRVLTGALSAGNQILEKAVDAARSDEAIRATRNAILLGKMLASINPEILAGIATAVDETLGSYKKPVIEPPGLFALLSQFRRKELRRSVALINRFLESLGNQIKLQAESKSHNTH
ncbi:MAG: DUF1641 domain-containing protein [Terracidiphilus sp.]|jgi:uncharacterized protein YjgD (DUF1641 family)